jgi:flagellar biosynthesis chaperone FliJ
MNKARRKAIDEAIEQLHSIVGALDEMTETIQSIHDDEEAYFENMPESLQGSMKGEAAETAMAALQEILEAFESARGALEGASDHAEEAKVSA